MYRRPARFQTMCLHCKRTELVMSRTAAKVTKAEIERILKGVRAGGFVPGRIEIEGGKIVIYAPGAESNDNASPLDDWRRKNGEG